MLKLLFDLALINEGISKWFFSISIKLALNRYYKI